ncbi:chaplin [Streptomyces sp. AM 4-1-1]|uniref:chaplin n=1 Tax=Streptomyces sp. AM 4-1-1 TaxID=3028710 RepID=UPI0023B93AB6|nr:chaplin [Streptomyces sp. AM 4-1-1]WEH32654.1 chaplin [Streptomyces sp. AM 4-1-1]
MRQVTRKGLITIAAAGGVLALSGGYAHADAGASGGTSNSPGVLSGNSVQIPIDVPVNVCGNTVSVVGLLNPAAGNNCSNGSGGAREAGTPASGAHAGGGAVTTHGGATEGHAPGGHTADGPDRQDGRTGPATHSGGASAEGLATGSPGVLSGNNIAVPVDLSLNVCGNGVTIGGLLNSVTAAGGGCENDPAHPVDPVRPVDPVVPVTPDEPPAPAPSGHRTVPNTPVAMSLPDSAPQLAHTGAGGLDLLVPASAGLLLAGAGAVLYRRARGAA